MINRIKIEGYKSIKKLDLELKPINILIGSNGVGKSNFLSFFKLVNNIYEQRLQGYVAKQGGADNLLHFGRKVTEQIKGTLYFDYKNSYVFELFSDSENLLIISNDRGGFNSEYGTTFTYKDTWFYTYFTQYSKESNVIKEKKGIGSWVNTYLNSFKKYHFHDTGENSPLRSSSQVDDNKYLKENGSNLPAFLYYLQEMHPKSFNRIEKTVKSIAPYFERFELSPDRLNKNMIKLEWKEINQPDGYFNASHLSDGTLRFIALATLLMQPDLPEVIIIDEPEIGMSEEMVCALGEWLVGILPILKKHRIGLMIITHSRLLIDLLYELTFVEDYSFDFKNLDGLNIEEYLNRKVVKADLGLLKANYLFYAVRERMHEVKKSEKEK